MLKNRLVTVVLVSTLAGGVAAAQGYQDARTKKDMTFSGTVESVNLKDHTFVLRNDENKGKVEEMKFKWGPGRTTLMIGTELKPIDELKKGDWVTVTWRPEDAMHMVKNVQRHKGETAEHTMQAPKPFTFTGNVESVNVKDQSFVVRNEEKGKVEELKFHLAPGTRLMLDGQQVLLSQLQKNDRVTIQYETVHTLKGLQNDKAS